MSLLGLNPTWGVAWGQANMGHYCRHQHKNWAQLQQRMSLLGLNPTWGQAGARSIVPTKYDYALCVASFWASRTFRK